MQMSYACRSMHGAGGRNQMDRKRTVHDFKTGVCNLLVATSMAARGLDVEDLIGVINYDPSNHRQDYLHRIGCIGRTGEAGSTCLSLRQDCSEINTHLLSLLAHPPSPHSLRIQHSSKATFPTEHGKCCGPHSL